MLDPFDYKEPICPLVDPATGAKCGENNSIPIRRVIETVDRAYDRNDYGEAERLLLHWLKEAEEIGDDRGKLSLYNELIGVYRITGQREKCLQAVEKALEMLEKTGQSTHVSGGTILLNCATAYKAFGDPDAAIALYEMCLEIYQKNLSKTDPLFGGFYNNMALTLADLGRTDEAIDAYQKALYVMEKTENGEPEQAITWINMATLYRAVGQRQEAEKCMDRAQDLLENRCRVKNGRFAFVLSKCAPAFEEFERVETAKKLKALSEKIYEGNRTGEKVL